ncbi:MAG: PH domain-containing protein [Planctomycetes bacterium]|nr:PH domain-containing protein [Planctomycetota bacterium]
MVVCQEKPTTDRATIRVTNGSGGPAGEAVAPQTSAVAQDLLADGEIVILRLKPSLWFIPLVSAPILALGVLAILTGNLSIVDRHFSGAQHTLTQIGLVIIALRLAWALLQWFARIYILTDRRVIRQRGVLNIQLFECPLERLQNTFVCRNLVQRVLGVGTIFFATAGTGQIEAMWQHVSHPTKVHKTIVETIQKYARRNGGP